MLWKVCGIVCGIVFHKTHGFILLIFFNYLFPPSLLSNASELMFRSRRSEPSVSRSGVSGPGALEVVIARVRRKGRKGESPLLFI